MKHEHKRASEEQRGVQQNKFQRRVEKVIVKVKFPGVRVVFLLKGDLARQTVD